MARSRLCRHCSEFHDLADAWPDDCLAHFGERYAAGPQIISDTIEPFRNMMTGKIETSKSRYRAELKARGMIEVGNENVQQRRVEAPPVRDTLRQSMRQLGA